jgi:uncharacterized protein (DUF697 family)
LEENSVENSGEQTKIKIKRSRRRLYQDEVNDKKTTEKPGKVKVTGKDASKSEKPEKEKDRDVISNNREKKANEIVKKNMYWAAGIELLPFPVFDLAALVAVQMKMIKDISDLYGIPFKKHRGKSFIFSLLGGFNVFSLSWITWYSFRKFIPGVGNLMGLASASAFGGATTYALGKVFIQHFEMGGTLLNFNPDKVRKYFQEQYEQGMKKTKKIKNHT